MSERSGRKPMALFGIFKDKKKEENNIKKVKSNKLDKHSTVTKLNDTEKSKEKAPVTVTSITKNKEKEIPSQDSKTATVEDKKDDKTIATKKSNNVCSKPVIISFLAEKGIIASNYVYTAEVGTLVDLSKLPLPKGYVLTESDKKLKIKVETETKHINLHFKRNEVLARLVPVSENLSIIDDKLAKNVKGLAGSKISDELFPKVPGYFVFAQRNYTFPNKNGDVPIVYGPHKQHLHVIFQAPDGTILKEELLHGKTGENYTVNPKMHSFDGYELDALPKNLSGVYTAHTPDVVLKFKPMKAQLNVSFVDSLGNTVHKPLSFNDGYFKGNYTIKVPKIDGYDLLSDPKMLSGKYNQLTKDVVLRFKRATMSFNVFGWFDQEHTKSIGKPLRISGLVGEHYDYQPTKILGYLPDKDSISGNFQPTGNDDINIVYKPISCQVNVILQDVAGRNIKTLTLKGEWGKEFNVNLPELQGYIRPKECLSGTYSKKLEVINIFYQPQVVKLSIQCFNAITNKEISGYSNTIKEAIVGSTYSIEPSIIDGFKLKSLPNNASGTVPPHDLNISFYYEPYVSQIVLHFFDSMYNSIREDEVLKGYFGKKFHYLPPKIAGHSFDKATTALSGSFPYLRQDIDLFYTAQNISFRFLPVDQFNKQIGLDNQFSREITGLVGQAFSVSMPEIPGFFINNYIINGRIKSDFADKIFKIAYQPLQETVTIKSLIKGGSRDGQVPFEDIVMSGLNGEKFEYTVPDLEGHSANVKVVQGIFKSSEQEITVDYIVNKEKYLIQFVDENNNLVGGMPEKEGLYGDSISLSEVLPKGYLLPQGMELAKVILNGSGLYKVTVIPRPLTVDLVALLNGQPLQNVQRQIFGHYHEPQEVEVPHIAGYVPVTGSKISLNFDLDQKVVSIDYKPEKRSITVRYLDTRGQAIAQPDVIEGFYQESYTIKAKDIDGYTVVDSDSLIKRGIYDQDNMETAFIYRAGSDEFNAAVISLDEVLQQQNNKTTEKRTEVNVIKQTPKNLLNEFDLDD